MKRFNQFGRTRHEVYERLFSAPALCAAGLLAMPAMLFNSSTPSRVIQFLFFWFLCWLAGKKNNPVITILVMSGIIVINLLVPYGKVLFSIGPFRISQGALMAGIQRAVTLEGLIMLSKLAVRKDLKLPGVFGELLGESFRFYSIILNNRKRISRKNLMGDLDALMLDLSNNEYDIQSSNSSLVSRTNSYGFMILAFVVILSWVLFFIGY